MNPVLAELYRRLPDTPPGSGGLGDIEQRELPATADPHPDYPWIDRHRVLDLEAGDPLVRARKAARFHLTYGFHWRRGPDDENLVRCQDCARIYCRPVGHDCTPAAPAPVPAPPADLGDLE